MDGKLRMLACRSAFAAVVHDSAIPAAARSRASRADRRRRAVQSSSSHTSTKRGSSHSWMLFSSGISLRRRSRNRRWSPARKLDAILEVRLFVDDLRHVAAFFFDRNHAIQMSLKRFDRELQAGKLARHAHVRGLPIERDAHGLLDVLQNLVLHADGGNRRGILQRGHRSVLHSSHGLFAPCTPIDRRRSRRIDSAVHMLERRAIRPTKSISSNQVCPTGPLTGNSRPECRIDECPRRKDR